MAETLKKVCFAKLIDVTASDGEVCDPGWREKYLNKVGVLLLQELNIFNNNLSLSFAYFLPFDFFWKDEQGVLHQRYFRTSPVKDCMHNSEDSLVIITENSKYSFSLVNISCSNGRPCSIMSMDDLILLMRSEALDLQESGVLVFGDWDAAKMLIDSAAVVQLFYRNGLWDADPTPDPGIIGSPVVQKVLIVIDQQFDQIIDLLPLLLRDLGVRKEN